MLSQLLVFSVTLFKIDQNKNQNRSTDKVKNVGNERRYIYDISEEMFYPNLQRFHGDLYGDAMLVLTWMSSNMADGNQQKHLLPSFATEA